MSNNVTTIKQVIDDFLLYCKVEITTEHSYTVKVYR